MIARYTITNADITNGTFATISGSFRDQQGNAINEDSGNSIEAQVFLNNSSIFVATGEASVLNNDGSLPSGNFNFGIEVVAGDTVSFVVFNNGAFFSDETALEASVDLADAPADQSPSILTQPDNQDLFIGDTLNLSVTASGTAPFTYQWRRDMVPIPSETNPTSTNSTFSIASVDEDDAASYDCVVTGLGNVTSLASMVTVSLVPPAIVTQPMSQGVIVGDTLTLSVEATGSDLRFQWARRDGDNVTIIDGVANPTALTANLVVDSVTLNDAGDYDVLVENDTDFVESEIVTVVVAESNEPPVAVTPAPDLSIPVNTPLILSVSDLATDPDPADTLTIADFSATSANGATISSQGSQVAYFPAADSTATDDTFTVDVTDGFDTITVTVTVDVLAIAAGENTIADASLDYVFAAGSLTTAPTTPPSGWSYLGSTAENGESTIDLTAGDVGDQGADYQGFQGESRFGTALVYGVNTADSDEFEVFGNGDANMGVVGTDILLHPGQGGENDEFVILRYTVSAEDVNGQVPGSSSISGSFRELIVGGNAAAQSISAAIYQNSNQLFNVLGGTVAQGTVSTLEQTAGTFDVTGLTLAAGDTIDFVVGINGHFGADETALQAAISVDFDPSLVVAPTGEVVIDSCGFVGSDFQVVVSGLTAGVNYVLRRSDDLGDSFPTTIGTAVSGTGAGDVFIDTAPPSASDARAFYAIFEAP